MPSDNIPLDQHSPPKKGAGRYLLSTLLVFTILTAGAFFAFSLVKSGPKAKRAPAVRRARLVEVTPVRFSNHRVIVEGMGTVKPAREINLYARVSGEIQWVSPSFVPGGLLTAGEKMLQIDAADYSLAVRERMAALNQANSNLKIELGQQSVALREFELLGESVRAEDRDLVLRLPQLESVRADVEKAKSQLKKAKLDLERTKITAPFNTVINTREADL
ncbi:MAG: efflux RND transporter periplasmic adaptor subunit, partial [Nitrospiria bacterium]